MIAPAHAGHLDLVGKLIRGGAADGCFDRELATTSFASMVFFANLGQALRTGQFVEADRGGELVPLPAQGYVYSPDDDSAPGPIGFALFKSIGGLGYELWLTAIERSWRGKGHGRAMMTATLGTPAGRMAHLVRVNREGACVDIMQRLLESVGYRSVRETPMAHWFVRVNTPPAIAAYLAAAPVSSN